MLFLGYLVVQEVDQVDEQKYCVDDDMQIVKVCCYVECFGIDCIGQIKGCMVVFIGLQD